jgi:hypothetical protein
MKCFVHVGFYPEYKEVGNPGDAINLAKNYLSKEKGHLSIRWRRDDLYPNNFLEYNENDIVNYLKLNGEVVLQLVEIDSNGSKVMGNFVNILTDAKEDESMREAKEALHRTSCDYKSPFLIAATGRSFRKHH